MNAPSAIAVADDAPKITLENVVGNRFKQYNLKMFEKYTIWAYNIYHIKL